MQIKYSKLATKKLVLAWDPDYTKLTEYEEKQLNQPECCEFLSEEEAYTELGINIDEVKNE